MHALIIEDSYILAMTIEDALRPLGYVSFDLAPNVAAALAAAEDRCPDLIVADQRLDTGTGTEAVRRICAGKPIPVVFVTGSASEVRAELPLAIIVDKPFGDAALHGAIMRAVANPFGG
ncbi:MAG: response regulator [Pseudomonadota bacterium]|nr:response regulator [Pseudomonadota bacterium]